MRDLRRGVQRDRQPHIRRVLLATADIQLTGTNPQVVTYTINPKAVWTDGNPITWEDIAAQVTATTGKDPRFQIASPNGSERVASVTRGVDDRQAVMTFSRPYADWRGMFAGNGMLLPKVSTTDPEVFNKGQLNKPGPSAGPFVISNVDRGAQRITLTRNPKWWGARPLLDSITFLVLDDAARIPALQNNAIDATGLGSIDDMVRVRRTKGVDIRTAPGPTWSHLTFNGATGSILADPALRQHAAIEVDGDRLHTYDPSGRDGDAHVFTSAGVTAGIDLALALVEDDHGTEVAQTVARYLVLYLRRPGGQTQFAAPVWMPRARRTPIRDVQEAIESEPGAAHSITDLARRAAMSPRHFTRVFTDEVGAGAAAAAAPPAP